MEGGIHMKIIVEKKNVYGNTMIYPVCDKAQNFAALAGTKTLSMSDIEIIKELGYSVELKQQTL